MKDVTARDVPRMDDGEEGNVEEHKSRSDRQVRSRIFPQGCFMQTFSASLCTFAHATVNETGRGEGGPLSIHPACPFFPLGTTMHAGARLGPPLHSSTQVVISGAAMATGEGEEHLT